MWLWNVSLNASSADTCQNVSSVVLPASFIAFSAAAPSRCASMVR
jgi:hypothetical protein